MIALTQDMRAALIEDCEKAISQIERLLSSGALSGEWKTDHELMLFKSKITLAALTAEPIGKITDYTMERCEDCYVIASEFKGQFNRGCNPPVDGKIYAAPPVPEIKRPDLLDIPDDLDLASAMAAINWYEMETKRLNGWGE